MARDQYTRHSGMSTTTKCQHGLVFSTLALLILIVGLVVFLSPVNVRSGAFVTPVTRTSNVSATTPYSVDGTSTVVVLVQQAAVVPTDTVVVTNTNTGYTGNTGNTGTGTVVVPADTVVVTNTGNTGNSGNSGNSGNNGNNGNSGYNGNTGTGTTTTNTASNVQYVRGPDGTVYAVPVATASAVVNGTSGNNYRRGKRQANGQQYGGSGTIVVNVYPVSAYGSGYMVSGNISSLVPAETYVVTFHQYGDMTGGCSQLGQGLQMANIPVGTVNSNHGGAASTGDNYIRHALVDANGTIISTANNGNNANNANNANSGATTYVIQNGVPVATSNLNTGYTNYASNNYGYSNYASNNNGRRGGNNAVLRPVSNGTGYTVVNQDGNNQTYYYGARAYGQSYNQNGLPSNVEYVIPGIDYSGNDTSYYGNDPNGVYNKLNPVSVAGTGNNDHVTYQNNTQNDESNVKYLPLQTVVNATNNTSDNNSGYSYVPVNYVPVSGYPSNTVVVVNPQQRSNLTTGYTQYTSANYVPRGGANINYLPLHPQSSSTTGYSDSNYMPVEMEGRVEHGNRGKRHAGPLSLRANRRDARDYDGSAIGTFVTDASGNGTFDFYIPESSACGNPNFMYGRTVAIRPVYGTTRNKRQVVVGQPVDGVFGYDINGFDGSGLNYQRVGNAGNTGARRVTVIQPDRLMPVDVNYAGQMRSDGMRKRFQRMINRPMLAPGMRMGQPICCGILGRA